MNKRVLIVGALMLASCSFTAAAGNGFVRGEVGRSDGKVSVDGLGSDSDHDSAYSVRGGYWYTDNFAVEAFYTNAFDKSYSDGTDTVGLKATALGFGVVGKKNFGDAGHQGAFVMGRVGLMHGKLEASMTGLGSDSESSTEAYFGVGAGYDFTRNFGVSVTYDYLKGSGDGIKVTAKPVMLGAEFRF